MQRFIQYSKHLNSEDFKVISIFKSRREKLKQRRSSEGQVHKIKKVKKMKWIKRPNVYVKDEISGTHGAAEHNAYLQLFNYGSLSLLWYRTGKRESIRCYGVLSITPCIH